MANGAVKKGAVRFYELLLENSVPTETGDREFRGSVTKLYGHLGISSSYYSPILRILQSQDCIEYVKRGRSGDIGSIVLLRRPPDVENTSAGDLTRRRDLATLQKEVERLQIFKDSITEGGLDIAEAIRNHDKRLTQLERTLNLTNSETGGSTESQAS